MAMKPGTVLKTVTVKNKNGKNVRVTFRYPRVSDAKELSAWLNKLRSEAIWLGNWQKMTPQKERAFLKKILKEKTGIFVLAIIDRKIVGGSDIQQETYDANKHVGSFGIGLLKQYTGYGIGVQFAKTVLAAAKKETSMSIIKSAYNADNKASAALHRKIGFMLIGNVPKGIKDKKGKYCTEVLLYKKIR
jgi:RimJ/RimL family protein N-acetyltransferase